MINNLFFLMPLWSLFHVNMDHQDVMRQHIVVSPPIIPDRQLLDDLFSHGIDPFYKDRRVIRFSGDDQIVKIDNSNQPSIITIPLFGIFKARDPFFPQFHAYSRSHYLRFEKTRYAKVMSYNDFCGFEDKLAQIVESYLDDPKNNWVVMLDDPFFIEPDSLRSYGMKRDTTTYISESTQIGHPDFICVQPTSDKHV